jgi:putative ABC transport system substrate-binding protein
MTYARLRSTAAMALSAIVIALLPTSSPAQGQRRVGMLLSGSEISSSTYVRQFQEGLSDLGYIPGKNVTLVVRYADGHMARLPELARELAREGIEVMFAGGDQGTVAAKNATQTIPIVMVACDALAAGLVSNFSKPEANLTGVTCVNSELAAKRFQLLSGLLPTAKSIGVVLNPDDARMRVELSRTGDAARVAGIAIRELPVRAVPDIANALKDASGTGAAVVVFDSFTFFHRRHFGETAVANRVATVFNFREYVEAGGLMSYGPNLGSMYRQSTVFIDRILKGARPADLPVQQPTKFEFVVNMKTARALGLKIPEQMLLTADHVIE